MCLGVPGQVVRIEENALGLTIGTVDFGGIRKEICLAYVPDVQIGEYVLVHVGFALSKLDEEEAKHVFEILREMGDLEDLEGPGPPADRGAG